MNEISTPVGGFEAAPISTIRTPSAADFLLERNGTASEASQGDSKSQAQLVWPGTLRLVLWVAYVWIPREGQYRSLVQTAVKALPLSVFVYQSHRTTEAAEQVALKTKQMHSWPEVEKMVEAVEREANARPLAAAGVWPLGTQL